MVVVAGALATVAVERLPVGSDQEIDIALLGHCLKRPVDSRETDILASGSEHVMQVLGRSEIVECLEHACHRSPLTG